MLRRRKLLGMCAESPASGARFVSPLLVCRDNVSNGHELFLNTTIDRMIISKNDSANLNMPYGVGVSLSIFSTSESFSFAPE